jgi:SAM-dependent methyltransferase
MSTASVRLEEQLRLTSSALGDVSELCASELLQKEHYDQISFEYESHYSDASSREYRRRFIYEPMFAGLNLSGMRVLDAMCGSGQTTEYLLSRNALVTGLDISTEAIARFRALWQNCEAACRSLLDSRLESNSFDCVVVVGGLHHIHPNVSEAVREIHRVLKPGGYFCFMEPHRGSIADIVRQFWYKHDRFFSDNEAAIDVGALQDEFFSHFTFRTVQYLGNLAFLLVLNSLIFRIPLRAKPFYSSALMALESLVSKAQRKLSSCFVVARWQKK